MNGANFKCNVMPSNIFTICTCRKCEIFVVVVEETKFTYFIHSMVFVFFIPLNARGRENDANISYRSFFCFGSISNCLTLYLRRMSFQRVWKWILFRLTFLTEKINNNHFKSINTFWIWFHINKWKRVCHT